MENQPLSKIKPFSQFDRVLIGQIWANVGIKVNNDANLLQPIEYNRNSWAHVSISKEINGREKSSLL